MNTRFTTLAAIHRVLGIRTLRLLSLIVLSVLAAGAQAVEVSVLDQGWEFRQMPAPDGTTEKESSVGTSWRAASMPGTVHTDLLAHGLIPDPYVGAPEAGLQWIGLADWEYRTTFQATTGMRDAARSELTFEGLDTFAEVFLNGERVLEADNAFRTWRIPVQGRLREGGNELRVILRSPIRRMLPHVQDMPYRIAGNYPSPYGDEPKDAMTANFVRKPGYHYGWDWGPRYVTAGLWRPVRLASWNAARVDDLQLRQDLVDEEVANVTAIATVDAAKPGNYLMRVWQTAPNGRRTVAAEQRITLPAGTSRVPAPIRIERPQRWYPAGYGAQPLYVFEAELALGTQIVDTRRVRTGLRSVELSRKADGKGREFAFVVNDIPVFAKGANSIPFDMFPSRVTPAQIRRVLQSAADANMNMVRSWGGGYYESDAFYDIAAELGLLVWQDFMFGGGMQPAYDPAFRANVVAEAQDQIRRLRNHPSIVLWCGNNEEEIAWKYWGHGKTLKEADPAFADRVWNGYVQLFDRDLRGVVEAEAGGIAYWPSSPSDDMAETANTPTSGDMHYWEVWGNPARAPAAYLDITPRFMSEYGLQAWPVPRTIDHFVGRQEQRIDSPVIEAHQKFLAGKGNERLLHYIRMEFGEPRDFADFVYLSQVMQAEGIGLAARHHRASQPYTMGSLYWQLNDVWPGASWSGVDWFGRWKALQFHARRFFAPVALAALRKDASTTITVVSDRTTARQGEWRLRVMDLEGRTLRDERRQISVKPLSATRLASYNDGELLGSADPRRTVAVVDLSVDGEAPSREIVYFTEAKNIDWPVSRVQAGLHRDANGTSLDVVSDSLARAVWIDFGDLDVEISDNALTLLPGERVRLRIKSNAAPEALRSSLHVRTLADALSTTSFPRSTASP
ncbi:glycoside hydrolase family 2 protein [Pseudoxanthomonas sp. PXM02]|uniref:beta-mannosidase n=1 Tax=Pseudoxanthomonas sp. PXM02 TaxID=2769294 RepID=UPI00177E2324|nr:glycoside hydrolase family 2 protein [Pseudoxanthomonas sp. PXM02]MBD9477446.1 glycoside hydrolase family 2 protein [Pseudoxanthomonas sp. PXM02]